MVAKHQSSKDQLVAAAVMLGITGLVFWGLYRWASSPSKPVDLVYNAGVGRYSVLNPSSVEVEVTVSNAGKRDGTPFCRVEISDESGSYKGKKSESVGVMLKPGESKAVRFVVPVEGNGAPYITSGRATCV